MSRDYDNHPRSGKRRRSIRQPKPQVRPPNLTSVKPVPASQLTFGTVVWAHIPFAECSGHKTRPAVVVAADRHHAALLPGFTGAKRLHYPDRYLELTDLDAAGLLRPTGLRLEAVCLERLEIINISGALDPDDADALRDRIQVAQINQLLQETHAA